MADGPVFFEPNQGFSKKEDNLLLTVTGNGPGGHTLMMMVVKSKCSHYVNWK